jgi:clan AA aspartic protease
MMGTTYAEITLKNACDIEDVERGYIKESEVRQMTVKSVVDTGAYTLFINEALRQRLGLRIESSSEVVLADDRVEICPTTGPVRVCWKDRSMICDALVFPGEGMPLLGAIPMEAMDLIVDPRNEKLIGRHGDKALLLAK